MLAITDRAGMVTAERLHLAILASRAMRFSTVKAPNAGWKA